MAVESRWDPMKGIMLAPAWTAGLKLLSDQDWHPWNEVAQVMHDASEVKIHTANGLLYQAVRDEFLERRGGYDRKTKQDSRQVRLTEKGRKKW